MYIKFIVERDHYIRFEWVFHDIRISYLQVVIWLSGSIYLLILTHARLDSSCPLFILFQNVNMQSNIAACKKSFLCYVYVFSSSFPLRIDICQVTVLDALTNPPQIPVLKFIP